MNKNEFMSLIKEHLEEIIEEATEEGLTIDYKVALDCFVDEIKTYLGVKNEGN